MIFTETKLKGAYLIDIESREDERGFFARAWCQQEFIAHGLISNWVQCNMSFNKVKGTLRGMHYQAEPYSEAKLVRCTMGAVFDVIIDLRPHSPTFKKWFAVELTAENRHMVYIPKGFLHGFQSLADNSEVFYQMSEFYCAENARGFRWNDPVFAIEWPEIGHRIISEKDRSYADFSYIDLPEQNRK